MNVYVKNYNKVMTPVVNVATGETAFLSPNERTWIDEGFVQTPTPGVVILKKEVVEKEKAESPPSSPSAPPASSVSAPKSAPVVPSTAVIPKPPSTNNSGGL